MEVSASSIFMSLGLVFLGALSVSMWHCVGMCGGIVLAYSSMKKASLLSHILYSVGRWCSYVGIGVVFALCGRAFALHHAWRELSSVLVGVLLMLYALMFALFPKILRAFEPSIQHEGFLARCFAFFLHSPSRWSFFGLGVINGLLPCGLVYFYALYTLNEQILGLSYVFGAVCIMSAFWLGTLASMLGVGMLGGVVRKSLYKARWWRLASALCMVLLGVWNVYSGI